MPGPSRCSGEPGSSAVDGGGGGSGGERLSSSFAGNNHMNGLLRYSQVTSREYDVRPDGSKIFKQSCE